jgi:hypothetical protein
MKTIHNRTTAPLRIPLPGGKILHLAPAKTGQVADRAIEHPRVRKLIEDGKIEVTGEGGAGQHAGEGGAAVSTSTHGHHPKTVVMPKGDR